MLAAFNTAASALSADSTAVSIVGNNLANLNTSGYKENSTIFEDVFSESLNSGQTQIGLGVQTPITARNFSQNGTLQTTTNTLDAAIVNQGFFVVKNSSGLTQYSRDGDFQQTSTGLLQNVEGEAVQGWTSLSGAVNTSGPIGDIVIPTGVVEPAVPTSNLSFTNINLDATAPVAASPASPTSTTPVLMYDSLGQSHQLTLSFTKTAPSTWSWAASLSDGTTTSSGTFNFDTNGNLTPPPTAPLTIAVSSWQNGAAPQNISFNLMPNGSPSITQYAQAFSAANPTADGKPATSITSASIGDGGVVNANLSNGQTLQVGQIALANFVNPGSLVAVGNNDFQVSGLSSQPSIGTAGTGGRGQIKGSSLEASTVDISTEFTNLITFQNSYSANSRVITTANSMEQTTLGLVTPGA